MDSLDTLLIVVVIGGIVIMGISLISTVQVAFSVKEDQNCSVTLNRSDSYTTTSLMPMGKTLMPRTEYHYHAYYTCLNGSVIDRGYT